MKVVISAGGTGGHIYPALAIINKIKEKEPNSEFLYIGTHNRMEKDIIPKQNIPFEKIEIYGFNRKNLFKNFKTLKCFYKAIKKCKKLIKDFNPDIVIGVGGYVTGPVIYSAKKLGYKTLIHEQNSIPGKANLFLSKYADRIAVSFKSTIKEFPEYKTIFTGNPCGENAINAKAIEKQELGLMPNKKLVLFVMGSLGSQTVNQTMKESMNQFVGKEYQVLYVTGKPYYESMKDYENENVKIIPYVDDMPSLMHATDLIVSRAGASTLAELTALGVPAILIPSPYVAANHQEYNARELQNNHAAKMILEKDLTGEKLISTIDSVINDQTALQILTENAKKLGKPNAVEDMYQEIISMLGD